MFLNSVVLVLQEILEAALLISVMLVFTHLFNRLWRGSFVLSHRWVYYSILSGGVGSVIFAYYTPAISIWFDYVGQEVVNAIIHALSLILLALLAFAVPGAQLDTRPRMRSKLIAICMAGVVFLSITREGSEIMLYVSGIASQPENFTPVIFGGLIGAGIGVSAGILLYYVLVSLSTKLAFRASLVLLCLIAGNTASQIALLMNQADWLPYTPIAWNSSGLISETSVLGHLLYALIGYEATPSATQVACYGLGIVVVVSSPLCRRLWRFDAKLNTAAQGVV